MGWSPSARRNVTALVAGLLAATGVAAVAVGAGSGTDRPLVRGDRNPLTAAGPGPVAATVPPTSLAPVPPTTLAPPVPMELPPGPSPAITRVSTPDPVIFLGIDDGYDRDPAVLDYLGENGIPFTAFLVTGALDVDPGYWARARASGGTVQAHTISHPNLTKISADQVRAELCGSADVIQQITGTRPTLFRPPYGAYNETVKAIAAECGYTALVMWKGTVNDGRIALQEGTLQAGDVLLLHWRPGLLADLQQVKALADAAALRIARLEEYLQPLP